MAPVSGVRLALDELARKRAELTAAIVTLARVEGIDPAPYLADDLAREATHGLPDAGRRPARAPGGEAPPRPSGPASRTTSETNRAHKVETTRPLTHAAQSGKVLQVLRARGVPLAQKELQQKTGLKVWTLREVLGDLVAAKTVTRTGRGRGQRFHVT